MPNSTYITAAVATQKTKNDKVREATDFVKKMQQIIAARRLEETRSNLGF